MRPERSPFKFLNAYGLKDREVFFGRDKEIEQLYELAFKAPLALVYGPSGTGKTSLVQCGLASRFNGPDWYPFFIRRGQNLDESIRAKLEPALRGVEWGGTLPQVVSSIYQYWLRPVYLIFDQFEELFTLGKEKEQDDFALHLRSLLDAELPCRILLVMREEYIGSLVRMEKVVPELFNFKLRVEQMDRSRLGQVISQSCARFNIRLQPPTEDRLHEILYNLGGENSLIQLPYLQVYLDMLYKEDFERTYKDDPNASVWLDMLRRHDFELKFDGGFQSSRILPELEFTKEEIEQFGSVTDVLEKFLTDQSIRIQKNLEEAFQKVPEDFVSQVLDLFATEHGTKRPLTYEPEGEVLKDYPPAFSLKASRELTLACVRQLIEGLILRVSSQTSIELAHDALAAVIQRNRSPLQQQRNAIRTTIRRLYEEYPVTETFLSKDALRKMEAFLSDILPSMDAELQLFVQNSKEDVKKKEEADLLEAKEREAEREKTLKLAIEKAEVEEKAKMEAHRLYNKAVQQRRRARIASVAAFIIAVFAGIQWNIVRQKKDEIEKTNLDLKTAKIARDHTEAKRVLQVADRIRQGAQAVRNDYREVYKELLCIAKDSIKSYDTIEMVRKEVVALDSLLKLSQ